MFQTLVQNCGGRVDEEEKKNRRELPLFMFKWLACASPVKVMDDQKGHETAPNWLELPLEIMRTWHLRYFLQLSHALGVLFVCYTWTYHVGCENVMRDAYLILRLPLLKKHYFKPAIEVMKEDYRSEVSGLIFFCIYDLRHFYYWAHVCKRVATKAVNSKFIALFRSLRNCFDSHETHWFRKHWLEFGFSQFFISTICRKTQFSIHDSNSIWGSERL